MTKQKTDTEKRAAGYLSPKELCERSGLTMENLQRLETVGLLRPTDKENNMYRPKLASWAHKLAYLLASGWTIGEIQQWSNERWSWLNPRLWPPPKPGYPKEPSNPKNIIMQ